VGLQGIFHQILCAWKNLVITVVVMPSIHKKKMIRLERQVKMERKIIGYLAPKQDAHLANSIAAGIVAGRDVITTNSGCQIGVAGRDLHLKNGYGGVLITGNQVHVEKSMVGILLGKGCANLQDSKVLFTGPEVAAMGVIAGLVGVIIISGIKLLRRLFRATLR
jgi:hypothetical protein